MGIYKIHKSNRWVRRIRGLTNQRDWWRDNRTNQYAVVSARIFLHPRSVNDVMGGNPNDIGLYSWLLKA